jgi:hypothetical protein
LKMRGTSVPNTRRKAKFGLFKSEFPP